MEKPDWWDWPFDCENEHLLERMEIRNFNEANLREMIEATALIESGDVSTRFNLYARYDGDYWKIVVEPDPIDRVVIVVTAFTVPSLP